MKRLHDKNTSVIFTLINLWIVIVSCNACSPVCDCVGDYFVYCDRRELTSGHLFDLINDLPVKASYIDFSHNVIKELTNTIFCRHTALTSISLDHNIISDIDGNTFHPLLRLRKLYLQHNQLPHLKPGLFSHLTQLQNLHINNNYIRHIRDGSFARLVNLRELRLNRNYLYNVTSEAFAGLTNLHTLDLSNNNIHKISDFSFASLFRLRKLFLKANRVSILASNSFWNLTSLRELDLGHNRIVSIHPKYLDPFRQHIRILRLPSNRLVTLHGDVFTDMASLKVLDLSYNRLKTIEENVFWHLDLNELYLEGNSIEIVRREMFLHTLSLKHVDLSHNMITNISPGAWAGLGQSLLFLNLTGNRLVDLSRSMMQGMTALRNLCLANNKILTIDPNFLSELTNLQTLDLRANRLRSLVASDFIGLSVVPRLHLEYNPLIQFSGFMFNGEVHVSLSASVTSKDDRTINITWPFKEGNQLYWSVSVKNLNRTEIDNDNTFYLQAYLTNAMIPGLSPLTHYYICVRPVFVDESVIVNQIAYVTTLDTDELIPPTTLRDDVQISRSSQCRPLLWNVVNLLLFTVILKFSLVPLSNGIVFDD
ncbi:insulin-like growth factor-binding protein complex acid labile subunit [Ylistrum balloti]|uniref:insulin-like growth factor-binding protein complex acid labile subunit n=1 Tax=Ylistrum balloti TaxID=509963 RepID=UPI002905B106|nr:insulin-like growth factor-binding protein complex acid labile subunit [Ylistrum balloti]